MKRGARALTSASTGQPANNKRGGSRGSRLAAAAATGDGASGVGESPSVPQVYTTTDSPVLRRSRRASVTSKASQSSPSPTVKRASPRRSPCSHARLGVISVAPEGRLSSAMKVEKRRENRGGKGAIGKREVASAPVPACPEKANLATLLSLAQQQSGPPPQVRSALCVRIFQYRRGKIKPRLLSVFFPNPYNRRSPPSLYCQCTQVVKLLRHALAFALLHARVHQVTHSPTLSPPPPRLLAVWPMCGADALPSLSVPKGGQLR